jgi:uncharacterized membrane protein YedE/YeeE
MEVWIERLIFTRKKHMTTLTESKSQPGKKPLSLSLSKILTQRKTKPYVHPYVGGALLGVVLFLAFFVTGNGLGASGGLNRLVVWVEDMISPAHIDQVPFLIGIAGGDKNPLDNWVVPVLFGTVAGGFISGWLNGRLKVETNKGPNISKQSRWIFALIGGVIMGFGARMARGCTSGQALSGGAVLSVGSWAFMFAVFAGGYAIAYFVRKLWN